MELAQEAEASLRASGQAEIWRHMFDFVDSLALKCAIDLRIPDIIHSHGGPYPFVPHSFLHCLTVTFLLPRNDSRNLERLMRLLVRKNVFSEHHSPDGDGEPLYGLTHASRWLVSAGSVSLGPIFLAENHPNLVNSWHFLNQFIREGGGNGTAIEKAFGGGVLYELMLKDQNCSRIFNEGMAADSKLLTREILAPACNYYDHGFDCLNSLVDVAGGIGDLVSEIVKSYPHIKGINFDLPHVIATAPAYDGVSHISGDMFNAIPQADALLLKWVLHNWGDEDCVKILKNCRKAIPEKSGKVIIIDVVLKPDGEKGPFDDAGYAFDLVMMVNFAGGKERTELQWKKILAEGGFPRYRIIKIPALQSIIEAYPK